MTKDQLEAIQNDSNIDRDIGSTPAPRTLTPIEQDCDIGRDFGTTTTSINTFEDALDYLRELKKLDINLDVNTPVVEPNDKIRFIVTFNLPINTNTNDFITKLLEAAAVVGSCGLEIATTKFVLPKCMRVTQ